MQSHSRSSLTSADLNEMTHLSQQATYQPPTTATNTASLAAVEDPRNGDFLHNLYFFCFVDNNGKAKVFFVF